MTALGRPDRYYEGPSARPSLRVITDWEACDGSGRVPGINNKAPHPLTGRVQGSENFAAKAARADDHDWLGHKGEITTADDRAEPPASRRGLGIRCPSPKRRTKPIGWPCRLGAGSQVPPGSLSAVRSMGRVFLHLRKLGFAFHPLTSLGVISAYVSTRTLPTDRSRPASHCSAAAQRRHPDSVGWLKSLAAELRFKTADRILDTARSKQLDQFDHCTS